MSEYNELIDIVALQLNHTTQYIDVNDWQKLLTLAKIHGLLQYIAFYVKGLPKNKLPSKKIQEYLFSVFVQEVSRSANQLDAVVEIQNTMENNCVYNLVVKGSVTKYRYENEILRSMGDIDLLYKPEQHYVFKDLMISLGYGNYQEGRKNDTYYRLPYIIVEAHRELVESGSKYSDYYRNVWQRAKLKSESKYTYEMSVEDELIFNIVHLAEHFKEGGAGVRFIIDIYIYLQIEMDDNYVNSELMKLGLIDFYNCIINLANFWFADGENSKTTKKLSYFILSGGVFGDKENAAALAVKDGKINRFINVCFPNYNSMKSMFPWLEGKRFMLPCAWVLRGVRAICYRKENVRVHVDTLKNGNIEKGRALKQFYSECGL